MHLSLTSMIFMIFLANSNLCFWILIFIFRLPVSAVSIILHPALGTCEIVLQKSCFVLSTFIIWKAKEEPCSKYVLFWFFKIGWWWLLHWRLCSNLKGSGIISDSGFTKVQRNMNMISNVRSKFLSGYIFDWRIP